MKQTITDMCASLSSNISVSRCLFLNVYWNHLCVLWNSFYEMLKLANLWLTLFALLERRQAKRTNTTGTVRINARNNATRLNLAPRGIDLYFCEDVWISTWFAIYLNFAINSVNIMREKNEQVNKSSMNQNPTSNPVSKCSFMASWTRPTFRATKSMIRSHCGTSDQRRVEVSQRTIESPFNNARKHIPYI